MDVTKRNALKAALALVVGTAAPAALLKAMAAGRVSSMKIPLADGSTLELTETKIYHLKEPQPNERTKEPERTLVDKGRFEVKGGGYVAIDKGALKDFNIGSSEIGFIEFKDGPIFMRGGPGFAEKSEGNVKARLDLSKASAKTWLLTNKAGDSIAVKGQ